MWNYDLTSIRKTLRIKNVMEKKTSKLLMEYKKFYLLIIVCLFSIGIFAQSGTEKISISFSKIPLKEAMARVEKASGYLFSYDGLK